jgi:translation initiation factor 4E
MGGDSKSRSPSRDSVRNSEDVEADEHALVRSWTLWYDPGCTDWSNWLAGIHNVHTVATAEEFWRLFNNIRDPSAIRDKTTYYLFEEGVKPLWEDPANEQGGKWTIWTENGSKKGNLDIDKLWILTVLGVIGKSLPGSENVVGITVGLKRKVGKISVWTKNAESEKDNMEIANGLVDLWGTRFAMSYTAHKEILNKGTPKDSKALYYFE